MKRSVADHQRVQADKHAMRERCQRRRREQADRPFHSREIWQRLISLPEYRSARMLSSYVSMPDEVHTLEFIAAAWNDGKQVAVPCCMGDRLRMFHLKSMEELAPRTLGILEPRDEPRQAGERWLEASQIDLFVVPGLAFDGSGGRLGYGKGYYDRLLAGARADAPKIALAFECQMVDRVPMTASDVRMDCVLTETAVFSRLAR